ncbi:hypothetical protein DFJ58DRAFT_719367 [Suillus subalutaceus]|uniref:uncharacterized protein n=1 Tax=Suillus subalutaceus TaxID=48586 RepID=UPI001B87011C|nr:uncharacterized protein DFJ58DRAFT_719367 [Suillus subalutaceus]KAG1834285.1 hypothetical protein DFJ58DRAFT_719367 [Suillus subalutaceus]
MGLDERCALEALRENNTTIELWHIWNGTEPLAISHAGGEFTDLAREVLGDFWKIECYVDNRTRRDRILRRNQAFTEQMPVMTDTYLAWSLAKSKEEFKSFSERLERNSARDCGEWSISVIDVFYATISSALVRQGVMPCSPISPTVGITTEALDLYRAFVKTVCDLQGVTTSIPSISIAFDLFLQIQRSVAALVAESLQCNSPDWRLKHACPACTLLYAMDGNDSLKRVLRRSLDHDADDCVAPSSEVPTGQQFTSDRYSPRAFEDTAAKNACAGRWKNMDDAKTKKAWGIYDETGAFVAVCRHGFSLLIADMVQSGELAKYPLAVVSKLMDVFGKNLGGGYDIGCQFKTTLDQSSLGPLARSLQHTCLVGAFHGHAHRRLCQLFSLTTYIKGLGLEDLETCERTFSKSNSLASALRYASVFHRQQAIDSYFKHTDDFEVYAHLSNFLHGNYKQALDILNDGNATLPRLMQDLGLTDESIFERWIEEEKPENETLQMEYWQRLVYSHEDVTSYDVQMQHTCKAETAQRHAVEDHERNLKLIQALECKLKIVTRWTPADADWQRVGRLVAQRKYQRALDRLEGLVIARIFELSKMNRAGTGYKLRKHIAKALQTRSVAIKTALNTYNTIAEAMHPPRQTLKWEEVVEYVFLADFDLLRDTRADVSQQPWSSAAARSAMDLYFKMCRAREEIQRLNVEVRRLVTYIRDEDKYLWTCKDQLKVTSPAIAHQIAIHRNARGRFNSRHLRWLHEISKLPGFSRTIVLGVSTNTSLGESCSTPNAQVPSRLLAEHIPFNRPSTVDPDTPDDLDDEEQAEEVEEEASKSLQDVLRVADDFSRLDLLDHEVYEE